MNEEQYDALDDLKNIQDELSDLSNRARLITRHNFPEEFGWCDAYDIFNFGSSKNPYDSTLEKLITNIEKREEENYE